MHHQQQDSPPTASVAQCNCGLTSDVHELIISPFLVYEYIQSYNTRPYGTKEILINLLNPRTSKRHYGGYGYFSSGSVPSVNMNPTQRGAHYNNRRSISEN